MRKRKIAVVPMTLILMLITILIGSLFYTRNNDSSAHESSDIVQVPEIRYEKIKNKNGKYRYEDDQYIGRFGIDVSEFQGDIDWQKVKDDGAEFVFIRLGRRGASTGLLYLDEDFKRNYENAKAVGLEIGIYFFSQAIDTREAIEEAHFVINELRNREIDLPVAYDCEEVYLTDEKVRTEELTKEEFTDNAIAFCKEIERAGYQPVVYTNTYWAETYYDMEKISRYPIWLAQYDVDAPVFEYPFSIWQYSHEGSIDGIEGNVDFNIMFTKK